MKYSICLLLVFIYLTEITSLSLLKKRPTTPAPVLLRTTSKKPLVAETANLSSSISKLLRLSLTTNNKKSSETNARSHTSSVTDTAVLPTVPAPKSIIPSLQNLLSLGSRTPSMSDEGSTKSTVLKIEPIAPSVPQTDLTNSLKPKVIDPPPLALSVAPVSDLGELNDEGLREERVQKSIPGDISPESILPEARITAVEPIKQIISVSSSVSSSLPVLSSLPDAEPDHVKTGTTGYLQEQGIVAASDINSIDPTPDLELVPVVEQSVVLTPISFTPSVDDPNLAVDISSESDDFQEIQDNQLGKLRQNGDLHHVGLQDTSVVPKAIAETMFPEVIIETEDPEGKSPGSIGAAEFTEKIVPSLDTSVLSASSIENDKLQEEKEDSQLLELKVEDNSLRGGDQDDVKFQGASLVPETIYPETINPETINPETIIPETISFENIIKDGKVSVNTVPQTVIPETIVPETPILDTIALENISTEGISPEAIVEPNVGRIDVPELGNELQKDTSIDPSVRNVGSVVPNSGNIVPGSIVSSLVDGENTAAPIIRITKNIPNLEITVNLPNQGSLLTNFGLNDLTGITMKLSSISGLQEFLSALPNLGGIPGFISDLSKALIHTPELGDLLIYLLSILNAILTSISGVTGMPPDNIIASVPGLSQLLDGLLSVPLFSTEKMKTVIPSWEELSLQLLKLETSNPAGLTALLDWVLNYLGSVLKAIPEDLKGISIDNILPELPDLVETSRAILSYFNNDKLREQYQSIPYVNTPFIRIHNNEINLLKIVLE